MNYGILIIKENYKDYTMDLKEVANVLIEKIKKDYNGDVSLVNIYGSYLNNDTHKFSDLDLFLVPKTKRGYNLGKTFILNGIGYDFWALSWERLEMIAKHSEGSRYSIITDGKVIYSNTEDDLVRFNKLKDIANEHYSNIESAKVILGNIYVNYFKLIDMNDLPNIRKSIIGIIYDLSDLLVELNGKPIKRIRRHQKQEILNMELVPEDFGIIYDKLFIENDINIVKGLLHKLIINTEKLFNNPNKESNTFRDLFSGFYEEMIQHYNKIYHACDTGDIYTPLFASVELTEEIERMFMECNCKYKLPDMVGEYDSANLNRIKEAAKKHQIEFVKILKENDVHITEFNSMNEFKEYLSKI
jgi:predicted nucleotidyltransferase